MSGSDTCEKAFPLEHYLEAMVRLLDAVCYRDVNHTQAERREILHYVYTKTAEHFSSPLLQKSIRVKPTRLQAAINTIVPMVVYCWAKVTIEQMADLSIQYTFMLLLDDSTDEQGSSMGSFFEDLVDNRPQRNAWWRLFNDKFPALLRHYGPFCSLALFRSSLDCESSPSTILPLSCRPKLTVGGLRNTVFQGCWVEKHNFQSLSGAHDYPQFLRRLNGLGHFVGASLFPGTEAQERELTARIASAMPHLEHWEIFVNDVMSFYKEFDDVDDQAILVRNYVRCGPESSIEEGLDRVASDAVARSEILREVFCDNQDNAHVAATVDAFCQGYITWHLSEPRYRLREFGERAGDSTAARKFREYLDAGAQCSVDAEYWAYPSVVAMAEKQLENEADATFGEDALVPRVNLEGPEPHHVFVV